MHISRDDKCQSGTSPRRHILRRGRRYILYAQLIYEPLELVAVSLVCIPAQYGAAALRADALYLFKACSCLQSLQKSPRAVPGDDTSARVYAYLGYAQRIDEIGGVYVPARLYSRCQIFIAPLAEAVHRLDAFPVVGQMIEGHIVPDIARIDELRDRLHAHAVDVHALARRESLVAPDMLGRTVRIRTVQRLRAYRAPYAYLRRCSAYGAMLRYLAYRAMRVCLDDLGDDHVGLDDRERSRTRRSYVEPFELCQIAQTRASDLGALQLYRGKYSHRRDRRCRAAPLDMIQHGLRGRILPLKCHACISRVMSRHGTRSRVVRVVICDDQPVHRIVHLPALHPLRPFINGIRQLAPAARLIVHGSKAEPAEIAHPLAPRDHRSVQMHQRKCPVRHASARHLICPRLVQRQRARDEIARVGIFVIVIVQLIIEPIEIRI